MIIVEDFGKSIKVTGRPEQVAMELELAVRTVREAFCKYLGEENGNIFFDEIIAHAKRKDVELEKEYELIRKENPEFVKEFEYSPVMQELMKCLGEA